MHTTRDEVVVKNQAVPSDTELLDFLSSEEAIVTPSRGVTLVSVKYGWVEAPTLREAAIMLHASKP